MTTEATGDPQDLIHYELISDGCTVNKEINTEILHHLRDAVRRKCPENGNEKLVSLQGNAPVHRLVMAKMYLEAQCDSFGASAVFSRHFTTKLSPLSVFTKCSKRTMIQEHPGSH